MDELREHEAGEELAALAGEELDDGLDAELAALFAGAFDELEASDELKASTLAAIFAQEAEENETTAAAAESEAEAEAAEPVLELLDGRAAPEADRQRTRTRRPRTWWLRVAAAVVAVSLATGGVAYATPASHVTVSSDDASVELGVNVFGRTISVAADDDELQALLDQAGVRGAGYEDALDLVLDACDERAAARGTDTTEVSPAVELSGPLAGEGSTVAKNVDRVVQAHAERRAQASAPTVDEPAVDDVVDDVAEPVAQPSGGPAEGGGAEPGGAPDAGAPGGEAPDAAPGEAAPGEAGPAGEQDVAPEDAPRT